jgi:hypothetical protein
VAFSASQAAVYCTLVAATLEHAYADASLLPPAVEPCLQLMPACDAVLLLAMQVSELVQHLRHARQMQCLPCNPAGELPASLLMQHLMRWHIDNDDTAHLHKSLQVGSTLYQGYIIVLGTQKDACLSANKWVREMVRLRARHGLSWLGDCRLQ